MDGGVIVLVEKERRCVRVKEKKEKTKSNKKGSRNRKEG
jgi:hypothetical protein